MDETRFSKNEVLMESRSDFEICVGGVGGVGRIGLFGSVELRLCLLDNFSSLLFPVK